MFYFMFKKFLITNFLFIKNTMHTVATLPSLLIFETNKQQGLCLSFMKIVDWFMLFKLIVFYPLNGSLRYLLGFGYVTGFFLFIGFNGFLMVGPLFVPFLPTIFFIYLLILSKLMVQYISVKFNSWIESHYFLYWRSVQFILIFLFSMVFLWYCFNFFTILYYLGCTFFDWCCLVVYADKCDDLSFIKQVPPHDFMLFFTKVSNDLSVFINKCWSCFCHPSLESSINVPFTLNNYKPLPYPKEFNEAFNALMCQRAKDFQLPPVVMEKNNDWSSFAVWNKMNTLFQLPGQEVVNVPVLKEQIVTNVITQTPDTLTISPTINNNTVFLIDETIQKKVFVSPALSPLPFTEMGTPFEKALQPQYLLDKDFHYQQLCQKLVPYQLERYLPAGYYNKTLRVDLETFQNFYLPYMEKTYVMQPRMVFHNMFYKQMDPEALTSVQRHVLAHGIEGIRYNMPVGYQVFPFYKFVAQVQMQVLDAQTNEEIIPSYAIIRRNFMTYVPKGFLMEPFYVYSSELVQPVVMPQPRHVHFNLTFDVVEDQFQPFDAALESEKAMRIANKRNAVVFETYMPLYPQLVHKVKL